MVNVLDLVGSSKLYTNNHRVIAKKSAKILNPSKTVLVPDADADCPMAHMATVERIEEVRREYEDVAVVCYVNSTAELKTCSDVCVTSANALKIVQALPNKNIFFIPDKNLGSFVAEKVKDKKIILNNGCCPIHAKITADMICAEKKQHSNALVLSHPECDDEILKISDYIGSTSEIINYVKSSNNNEFIICTEKGIKYELTSNNPQKRFYFPNPNPCCKDMKLNTLEKLLSVLKKEDNEITISEEIRNKALLPLERMLELGK